MNDKLLDLLQTLYKEETHSLLCKINTLAKKYKSNNSARKEFSEKDIILIMYANSVIQKGEMPLQTAKSFLDKFAKDTFPAVHFLPFYPYSSDDGYAVIDYNKINPDFGTWSDVEGISQNYELAFDGVFNHTSASNKWFIEFLDDNPEYKNFYLEMENSPELSKVIRPRAIPLLNKFTSVKTGLTKQLWTTYSLDQIDLNYREPMVLLKIISILFEYIAHGAKYIRFDGIPYMWKEVGTNCVGRPENHIIIKIFRACIDLIAQDTVILAQNDSGDFFGNGKDEAQIIYQYAIAPLMLYSFHSNNPEKLVRLLNDIETLNSNSTVYLNYLSCHDGIGVVPAQKYINDEELNFLIEKSLLNGGDISLKNNSDGTTSPYEINVNYLDGIKGEDNIDIAATKLTTAFALILSLQGIPAIYFHSFIGARNDLKGVEKTKAIRSINRESFDFNELEKLLSNPDSINSKISTSLSELVNTRKEYKCFSPESAQEIYLKDNLVYIKRDSSDSNFIGVFNFSNTPQQCEIPSGYSNIVKNEYDVNTIPPYGFTWAVKTK